MKPGETVNYDGRNWIVGGRIQPPSKGVNESLAESKKEIPGCKDNAPALKCFGFHSTWYSTGLKTPVVLLIDKTINRNKNKGWVYVNEQELGPFTPAA